MHDETKLIDSMYNVVHVDEKWFNHDTAQRRYYLTADEEPPHRVRHSARFIEKSMFLVGVAKPR